MWLPQNDSFLSVSYLWIIFLVFFLVPLFIFTYLWEKVKSVYRNRKDGNDNSYHSTD